MQQASIYPLVCLGLGFYALFFGEHFKIIAVATAALLMALTWKGVWSLQDIPMIEEDPAQSAMGTLRDPILILIQMTTTVTAIMIKYEFSCVVYCILNDFFIFQINK